MPSPEAAKALVDLGSTVMLVLLVVLILWGLFTERWVPGTYYRREREAREVAEDQAERNAASLAVLARYVSRERRKRPLSTSEPSDPA